MSVGETGEAEGLWQLIESVAISDDLGKQVNDVVTFLYCGDTVTLRLATMNPSLWRSKDDFYKLTSRWEGSTLLYRPPFADFTELATFEDGRFVNIGNGIKRIFKKIGSEEVVAWNRAILAPREVHDYRTLPNGSLALEG